MNLSILTYCTGYDYNIYERFTGSLYDTGFNGILYFVIKSIDIEKINKLQKTYPNVKYFEDNLSCNSHVNNHRFRVIQKYYDSIEKCDYILFCDSRDVLFQKNPQEYKLTDDIYVFEEDKNICEEGHNTRWIQEFGYLIGKNVYDEINHKRIICCGTTICSYKSLQYYIKMMNEILDITTKKSGNNLDQAIHNYLVYYDLLKPFIVKILNNNDNLVNTIGVGDKYINSDDKITNHKGDVSYIVHQYDRGSEDFLRRISKKYNFR